MLFGLKMFGKITFHMIFLCTFCPLVLDFLKLMCLYLPKFSQSRKNLLSTYRIVPVLVIKLKVPVPYFFQIVSPIKGEPVLLQYGFGSCHGKIPVYI